MLIKRHSSRLLGVSLDESHNFLQDSDLLIEDRNLVKTGFIFETFYFHKFNKIHPVMEGL